MSTFIALCLLLTFTLLSVVPFPGVAKADMIGPAVGGAQPHVVRQAGTPLGDGLAKADDPWWMETIKHQGTSPTNPDPAGYRPFRNVKDFGAIGDGLHDDTNAINRAIAEQGRCGLGCNSSTVSPAIVYFPRGTYLVSAPIIPFYYTQLVGDAKNPPTLLAAATFDGMAVIDADPYIPGGGGAQYWTNQNNFFRSVRNFVIDVRRVPPERPQGTALHWQVAQATSLVNIVVHMSEAPNTAHQGILLLSANTPRINVNAVPGIWMENGSGGFMGDLVFNGGRFGIWGGNQQFTVRNLTVNRAKTAVYSLWNWGWTYQGVTFNNCGIGFEIATGGLTVETQSTGAQAIIDAVVLDTPIFIQTTQPSNGALAGSLVLNNARLTNVPVAVSVENGPVVLQGGTRTIQSWAQGNIYRGSDSARRFVQNDLSSPRIPSSLLDSSGKIVGRAHPQYENYAVSEFINVKDHGARGDGRTDDTQALNEIFSRFADRKILFFDAGHYIVTDTVLIPPGTRMVGEAWTVLAGRGGRFNDQQNPRPVFKVGNAGDVGVVEITDIVFQTVGPTAGAIVVEWNIREPQGRQAHAGMWDSHIRTAGTAGTNLEGRHCPKDGSAGYDPCYAAFLSLHITKRATAYLEGTWVWLADHDLDGDGFSQITVYSGRGLLSESEGPVWLVGTGAEHHVIYQYRLVDAKDHYMGLIQTESPYYQPSPPAPIPFQISPRYRDPVLYDDPAPSAWGLSVTNSHNIFIFGAGLYSFFRSYSQDCIETRNCQAQIANIDDRSAVHIFSLSTVASTYQISVENRGIINQADNINGFASTVTYWSSL
ncbi:glucan 1,3-beta-glucosidase [Coprinopsis marcescibilis]|uniref:Glucan 1,3-beta-glucosidase n=1 Tax=Coprinopsis marcescibilis TaxID=230819 RepID=A0A5C3KIQ0_COPMA|nr:glucan 1,3-beta-glucosidase [Coprinopsis marcescibilis]